MRVLLATMQFGPGYTQGAEQYVADLGEALTRLGHEVVYLGGDPAGRRGAAALGETVGSSPRLVHWPARSWLAVEGTSPGALLPVLRREQVDLVHLANPAHVGAGLIPAARALGLPVVVTVVDYWWLCPKGTLMRGADLCDATPAGLDCVACIAEDSQRAAVRVMARLPAVGPRLVWGMQRRRARRRGLATEDLRRWPARREYLTTLLNLADAVIFLSQTAAQRYAAWITDARAHVIRVGLAPRWFALPRPRREPGTAPVIGFAGALEPHKGPHVLLEAVRRLGWRDVHVRLAGGMPAGGYARRLRRLASGLPVEFAGLLGPEQMPAFLASLDLLVVPSLWPENIPHVVLEAQAVGTPVLGSDVPGIAEVLEDSRWRFRPGDAAALADRLYRWRAGELPALAVRPEAADVMARRTLAVYEQALAGRALGRGTGGSPYPAPSVLSRGRRAPR